MSNSPGDSLTELSILGCCAGCTLSLSEELLDELDEEDEPDEPRGGA